MGYNLWIGEAEVHTHLEDRCARVGVATCSVDGSPLNSTDNHDNCIWPSYSTWADFTRRHGLYDVFFAHESYKQGRTPRRWWTDPAGRNHTALLDGHPGAVALAEAHYQAFKAARDRFQPPDTEDGEYDRRRLEWLVWWTRWALDNCKYPTFANS